MRTSRNQKKRTMKCMMTKKNSLKIVLQIAVVSCEVEVYYLVCLHSLVLLELRSVDLFISSYLVLSF